MWQKLLVLLKKLLPFVANEAEKVAPEIQAKIDAILKGAKVEVEALKANHSVSSIKAQMEADLKAVQDTAAHHCNLIRALAEKQVAEAAKLLPNVGAQLNVVEPAAPSPSPTPAAPAA